MTTHIDLLKPLDIDDFKLLLAKDWDLNCSPKGEKSRIQTRGAMEEPEEQMSRKEIEQEVEKEEKAMEAEQSPDREKESEEESVRETEKEELNFNNLHVEWDMSRSYRESVTNKRRKKVEFTQELDFQEPPD